MRRSRVSTAAGVALILILAAVLGVSTYFVTQAVRSPTVHRSVRPAPPAALARAAAPAAAPRAAPDPSGPAGSVTAAGVRRALDPLLTAPAFGGRLELHVADLSTGATLADRSGSVGVAPASTAKLLVAASLLAVRQPTDRLRTMVRAGVNAGTVVLVGDGDPTLSGAPGGTATAYPGAARISDLAAQVRAKHVVARRIVVDDSLFSGPAVSAAWAAEDVPSSYGAPVTAALVDGGRDSTSAVVRSATPDLAAGRALARALGAPGLPVTRTATHVGTGQLLGAVESAPIAELIEQMLHESDNVIAECLARQVALATARPASFAGEVVAIRAVLGRLGVPVGAGMRDASGLARSDRLTPAALTAVVALAARTPRLRTVLTALPVAAWSGTLAGRYRSSTARAGAGTVRAKTGTLTGVAALAGIVHTAAGTELVFAALSDRATSTPAAEAALDNAIARLAACGCR